jgi:cytochrome c biogenesis protein CcmG/thiol:disulfide interchange protein DsbE
MTEPNASRPFPLVAVLVALAVVVGIGVAIALARGGDDDDGGTATSDVPAFGPVVVEGAALPAFETPDGDPGVGRDAPLLEGVAPDGSPVVVGDPGDQPTLVVFLAHWCPHCQAEVPLLVDLEGDGGFQGVRLVGVLTGTSADAPNYPPVAWLEREGWPGEVLLDDEEQTGALAYGLGSYPYMVALDSDGRVVGRVSGEQPREVVEALLEARAEAAAAPAGP